MTGYRITPARVVRAEWHKLWTVRSTWITLLTAAALTLGIGVTMGATYESGGNDSDMDVVVLTLIGFQLAQIAIAVLGILVTAGEYSNGMIRASMTAVPRRQPVLWSKAVVFGAASFAVILVTALVTFFAAQIFFSGTDQAASLGDPGVIRAVVGSAAGVALLGMIALGLGALVRSVPGAIGAFIGVVLVLPQVLTMLPYDVMEDVVRHFPAGALTSLNSAQPVPDAASPGVGLLSLVLWAAGVLVAAALLLRRRDV
ncbi:ABC transporter permease [Streptomyces sp. NPDC051018]|uniref:ABC transporter permease n=1 Tax=Streptomyces sp. NPDC051018 TaxID=3365639 RepID=UPI003789B1AD